MKLTLVSSAAIALACFLCAPSVSQAQQQLQRLNASDAAPHHRFGGNIAVEEDLALIGAAGNDAAYLFDLSTGQELRKLSSTVPFVLFGWKLSMSGRLAAISAIGESPVGAVHVYDVTTGQLLVSVSRDYSGFGSSVAIHGLRFVVGARGNGALPGAVYVFDALTGTEIRQLTPPDGAGSDFFGSAVAMDGSRVFVGAPGHDPGATDGGAGYLFDLSTGLLIRKIVPTDLSAGDGFGRSPCIDRDLLAVGQSNDDTSPQSIYLFDLVTGEQLLEIEEPTGVPDNRFGIRLGLSGTRIVAGADRDDAAGGNAGAAFVFDALTGTLLHTLTADDALAGDWLGADAVVFGSTVLLGATGESDFGADAGSAYVFHVEQPRPYCFGDGSGTACPCGNPGAPERGCAHSAGPGAIVQVGGSLSVSADDLIGVASELPPLTPALFFAGDQQVGGGDGLPFGDGLRCAGGGVRRLGTVQSDGGGAARFGPGLADTGGWSPGDTRRFQVYFRDPAGPCGSGFNATNGVEVAFLP